LVKPHINYGDEGEFYSKLTTSPMILEDYFTIAVFQIYASLDIEKNVFDGSVCTKSGGETN